MAMRAMLADAIFKVPPEKMHVLTRDVGGGFGMKTQAYPEYVAILYAAKAIGRPVTWQGSRSAAFLADNTARDGVMPGGPARAGAGEIPPLPVDTVADMGAPLAAATANN